MNLPQPNGTWSVVYTPEGRADGIKSERGVEFRLYNGGNAECFRTATLLNANSELEMALSGLLRMIDSFPPHLLPPARTTAEVVARDVLRRFAREKP